MRIDLNGTNVKVTAINPGLVETEFSLVRYRGDKDKAGATYKGLKALTGDDVADAVYYAVTRSPNVVVAEMLVLPLPQATTTIVHRKS
jgi:NADP-dependent 3-hydroxy acid dehydrogenase YdfG